MKKLTPIFVLFLALSLTACAAHKCRMKPEAAPAAAAKTEPAQKEEPKAVPEKPVPAPALSAYIVKRNDSLERIARKKDVYGDRLMWPVLFEANRDKLTHPSKIYPGQRLRIPRDPNEISILKKRAEINRVRSLAAAYQPPPPALKPAAPPIQKPVLPQPVTPLSAPAPLEVPTAAPPAPPAPASLGTESTLDVEEEEETVVSAPEPQSGQ